jgi:diguanylate cyclase (GGDEF)-like protein
MMIDTAKDRDFRMDSDSGTLTGPDWLVDENRKLKSIIADLRGQIRVLEILSDSDPLVPLPNRRAFVREVERAIAAAARHSTPSALLFVDIDGLKAMNDAHGHSAGDALLIHVAHRLKRCVRAGDMVARIGGDEFALLLDQADEAAARVKAAALSADLALHSLPVRDTSVAIKLSIGIAIVTREDSAESVIARADAAMYAQRSDR